MQQPGPSYNVANHIWPNSSNETGFTLVEVLVSVAIMAISIGAVFGFVAVSDNVLQKAQQRERLDMIVTDIVETVQADKANIAQYAGKNLSACAGLTASAVQLVHLKRWCAYLNAESGEKQAGDTRQITVIQKTIGEKTVNVLTIELTSNDGKNTVFAKRVFDAP